MSPMDSTSPLPADFLAQITADSALIREVLVSSPAAEVPSCPGWNVPRLAGHVSRVHRMATLIIEKQLMQAPSPKDLEAPPIDPISLREYFDRGLAGLIDVLSTVDPSSPAWNVADTEQVSSFWARRMAHETSVHRADAELAAGKLVTSLFPDMAIDGVDEFFMLFAAQVLAQKPELALPGTVHLHATDGHGEWMISLASAADAEVAGTDRLIVTHGHAKGDAAIRGTASDLFLGLWGRLDLRADSQESQFEHFGNPVVATAFAHLGAF
jgi:uncharacterized protein (TIGR03083 family)